MEPLNTELVTQTLNYHGQQLQKAWETGRGEQDLSKHNVKDLNFNVYVQRMKYLSFQDRAKRLKLQHFIVKKVDWLFGVSNLSKNRSSSGGAQKQHAITEDMYAIMPPFETYINVDKQSRLKYFFENVKIGNLILGTIVSKTQSGMMLKVLCTLGPGASAVYYVADINVKAFCPVANIIPAVDRKGVTRSYMMNDSVCCEVLEVIPDTDKMVCGMKGTTRQSDDMEHRPALGLVSADDFPLVYKKALDHKGENYDSVLEKSVGFNNPNNISYLSQVMGLSSDNSITAMHGLSGRFSEHEYAHELRQQQASKWAYRNVADGIEHFKAGRYDEAFQCLNKALNIDPKNVEGLVARGALFANSGDFQKAIEDFETALKLNPSHTNARKYMGETLVALGRSYEDENKFDEARKAYQSCLSIIPLHEEAQNSLEFLKNKSSKNLIEPGDLLLPNLGLSSGVGSSGGVALKTDVNDALKQLLKNEEDDKKDKKKKKKGKKRKSRRRSSSSSSSSSSGSNDSSSSSSSSSSDSSSSSGDSDFKKRKKRSSRSHRREKQNSLSPLSKRMALMDPTHDTPAPYQFNKPAASTSFDFAFEQPSEPAKVESDDYEHKVRAFLEHTKGDSDYEEKVRKFLEESARWKKDKKGEDKKKKKKKEKKVKKESKKKRKEKKIKRKHFDLTELDDLENKKLRDALKKELGLKEKRSKRQHGLNSDDEDYLLQKAGYSKRFLDSLPDLEELESKLNAYYALEKETKRSELSDSPKRSLLDSPSPTREQKARQTVAEAAASAGVSGTAPKWKMQIANAGASGSSSNSRFKKKTDREEYADEPTIDRRSTKVSELLDDPNKKVSLSSAGGSAEKSFGVRKVMTTKEPPQKKEVDLLKKPKIPPPVVQNKPLIPPGQVVLDKFGNFRLLSPNQRLQVDRNEDLPPLPPGAPPKDGYSGVRKPPEPPGRPRSGSRSSRRSRSRSRGRKYSHSRSSSMSRSRSRSYRSRSRSYYSRSRSRSGSYYSRSRSRSRSYSGDRRRYRRGGFRGGRYGDRGTYYKPRLPPRGGGYNNRGRGNYYRDSRDGYRDYRGRGRPYNSRGPRRPRGRFNNRGGYRDYRDRRYERSRSRDRSRSLSGSRERESIDTMRKVHAEKDKINKYLDNDGEPIRHEGPLSEGEDRDDYSTEKYIDREVYDGKWGEKSEGDSNDRRKSIPNETNLEEMDRFLDKAKKDKKEEMMERNKDFLKDKS